MPDLTLKRTTYYNCDQKAWAVEDGSKFPLFYIVQDGSEWSPRTSLGRGFISGTVPTFHGIKVRARTLTEAKRRIFYELAAALEARSIELNNSANLLREAVAP